ncbi:MAG: MFS transporter [Candidatus Saccharimonadaceae bacterium]
MINNNKGQSKFNNGYESVNPKIVFPIIALALLMITIDSTIVATALHALQTDLKTSVTWAGWTMTIYSFGFALMLPLSAKLSIQYGHRLIFLCSIATFTISSLLCGLSTNIYMLIAMRSLQAIGGAGITPSATGIIVNHFHTSRDKFLGLFGSMFSVGAMIGPIFGGIFVTYYTWQWIFHINIPIGILVFFLALRFIPRSKVINADKEKLDFLGMIYLAGGIITAMYATTYLGKGISYIYSPLFSGFILLSIAFFTMFFRHLKRVKSPFINPRFIYGKGFGAVNIVNFIHTGMVIGAASLIPFYAVTRYGISELHSGTLLVMEGIASVLLSVIMSIYLRRTGYRMPLYIGSVILAIGVALLSFEPLQGISPYVWLSMSTFLVGIGFGVMSPAARNAGIQLAPEQSANLAAIRSLGLQMGQILSIAVATSIIASATVPGKAQAFVYVALSIILFISIPVMSRVPENKGSW